MLRHPRANPNRKSRRVTLEQVRVAAAKKWAKGHKFNASATGVVLRPPAQKGTR